MTKSSNAKYTYITISAILMMAVSLVVLMFEKPMGGYAPWKWIMSIGMFYCAGYFICPRRKAYIQDSKGEPVSNFINSYRFRSIYSKVNPFRFFSGKEFYEVDQLAMKAEKWKYDEVYVDNWGESRTRYRRTPADYAVLEKHGMIGDFGPISVDTSSVCLLLSFCFNPLVITGISKGLWLWCDVACFFFLGLLVFIMHKEKSGDLAAIVLKSECGWTPLAEKDRFGIEEAEYALLSHPAAFSLAFVTVCVFVLKESGVLLRDHIEPSEFLFSLVGYLFAAFLIAALGYGVQAIIFQRSNRPEPFVIFAITIFFFFITTDKYKALFDAPKPPEDGDYGDYGEDSRHLRY